MYVASAVVFDDTHPTKSNTQGALFWRAACDVVRKLDASVTSVFSSFLGARTAVYVPRDTL